MKEERIISNIEEQRNRQFQMLLVGMWADIAHRSYLRIPLLRNLCSSGCAGHTGKNGHFHIRLPLEQGRKQPTAPWTWEQLIMSGSLCLIGMRVCACCGGGDVLILPLLVLLAGNWKLLKVGERGKKSNLLCAWRIHIGMKSSKDSQARWGIYIIWRMKWQPTPVFLPGKSHGQRSLAGHSSWSLKRVGHDLVTKQREEIRVSDFKGK